MLTIDTGRQRVEVVRACWGEYRGASGSKRGLVPVRLSLIGASETNHEEASGGRPNEL